MKYYYFLSVIIFISFFSGVSYQFTNEDSILDDLPEESLFCINNYYYNHLLCVNMIKNLSFEDSEKCKFDESSQIYNICKKNISENEELDVYLHNVIENEYYNGIVVYCDDKLYTYAVYLLRFEDDSYDTLYELSSLGADPDVFIQKKSILIDSLMLTNVVSFQRNTSNEGNSFYNFDEVKEKLVSRNLKNGCLDYEVILSESSEYYREAQIDETYKAARYMFYIE